jgi:hypothetical protein
LTARFSADGFFESAIAGAGLTALDTRAGGTPVAVDGDSDGASVLSLRMPDGCDEPVVDSEPIDRRFESAGEPTGACVDEGAVVEPRTDLDCWSRTGDPP